jgi:hypothetical protein
MPPSTTPHMGRAPVKRPGCSCASAAVMIPPNEVPQAMVRAGWPQVALKKVNKSI